MTIRAQVDDAAFLAQHGRYVGALTTLMLAIAASARRTFPQGTMSREKPKDKMSDREAFSLFLGGRIRKIFFGNHGGPDEGTSGISVPFRGEEYDIAFILYKFYRCELVHDGKLPTDVEFSAPKQAARGITISNRDLDVSIGNGSGNTMVLDYGWIDLLIEAVRNARCNGPEFGIKHFDLLPIAGIDDTKFLASLMEKYGTSLGRIEILKHVVRRLSSDSITGREDRNIVKGFGTLVKSQEINGGAVTGLTIHGFTDSDGVLQQRGIELLRDIASRYHLVEVA